MTDLSKAETCAAASITPERRLADMFAYYCSVRREVPSLAKVGKYLRDTGTSDLILMVDFETISNEFRRNPYLLDCTVMLGDYWTGEVVAATKFAFIEQKEAAINFDTIKFWLGQDEAAKQCFEYPKEVQVHTSQFISWFHSLFELLVDQFNLEGFYSHRHADIDILNGLMDMYGNERPIPWATYPGFRLVKDAATVSDMSPLPRNKPIVAHDSWSDCAAQIQNVVDFVNWKHEMMRLKNAVNGTKGE